MKVTITGARELGASLDAVNRNLDSDDILRGAATRVQRAARVVAPKRSGRLARSIIVRGGGDSVRVGTTVNYAQYVAYGSIHNPNPVPFLERAIGLSAAGIAADVEREVDAAIGKAGF